MKQSTSMNKGLAAFLLFISLLVVACGGGGSQFGSNSDVELVVTSNDIEDLSVIVSPREGGPDASNACRENNSGFGCDIELFNDATQYFFRTNSDASDEPFHVYVRNFANVTRRGTLDIWMDDDLDVSIGFEVFANETFFIARIFRNNADFNDTRKPEESSSPRLLRTKAEKEAWMKGDNEAGVPLTQQNYQLYKQTRTEQPEREPLQGTRRAP